jgi:hypothetical protein
VATVVGFDINRNAICHWSHDYKAHVPVKSAHLSDAVEFDPQPVRRNKDADTETTTDVDLT